MVAAGTDDNVIEDNTILGNANGVYLAAGVAGNIIRRNVIAANPPVQVSVSVPAASGWDIRNLTQQGTNIFEDNFCLTSLNADCRSADDMHRRVR